MYVSLHNRSAYSFGSSLLRPAELAAIAAHHGMPAVAITDWCGLYGAVQFQQACDKHGVKAIFGATLPVRDEAPRSGGEGFGGKAEAEEAESQISNLRFENRDGGWREDGRDELRELILRVGFQISSLQSQSSTSGSQRSETSHHAGSGSRGPAGRVPRPGGAVDMVAVVLLAQTLRGYTNLSRLISLHHLRDDGIDIRDLCEHAADLVCIIGYPCASGDARGRLPFVSSTANGSTGGASRSDVHVRKQSASNDRQPIGSGDSERHALKQTVCATQSVGATRITRANQAKWGIEALRAAFAGRLYVELAIHTREDVEIARRRARWADAVGIPVVATCEARCANREDGPMLRALASIGTLTLLERAHSDKPEGHWHFRSPAEMAHLFARRPDALANTRRIAESCYARLDTSTDRFPAFESPDGRPAIAHLRDMCLAGCRRRYLESRPYQGLGGRVPRWDEVTARLERELSIIEQVQYAEYFLVFHEIVEYCNREGIATLARGSAADSLVCYALGVSQACPFRFDLPFDRFVNPERAKFSKMADIDLDLPWDQRDQVIRWVYDRWGHDRVAMIGTANTFHARAAVAELGKIWGLPAAEVYRATKFLPRTSACDLPESVKVAPEAREVPVHEEPYRTILRIAGALEGLPRHWSMHPCGIVVSPAPLNELVPVQRSPKGPLVAQYDMEAIEELGFIKIDLLGQAGLSVLRDTVAEINRTRSAPREVECKPSGRGPENGAKCGRKRESEAAEAGGIEGGEFEAVGANGRFEISNLKCQTISDLKSQTISDRGSRVISDCGYRASLDVGLQALSNLTSQISDGGHPDADEPCVDLDRDVDYSDAATWDMIARGEARGVHHIESPAMTTLIVQSNCRDIDCLTSIVALIRPGAANQGKKEVFARRHQGMEPPSYAHPAIEPILRGTYGLMMFEEHILQIAVEFAGMNIGRADVLRRALNKENRPLIAEMRREFEACARRAGRSDAEIAAVWAVLDDFSGFMFNKAHSAEYAMEAFQGAWLKRRWPAHYIAAILSNYRGFYAHSPTLPQILYVLEAIRCGARFVPPCVNRSRERFAVEEVDAARAGRDGPRWNIRVPLSHIKGISSELIGRYRRERVRGPFASLADFVERCRPGEADAQLLLDGGAFDVFGGSRPETFWQLRRLLRTCGEAGLFRAAETAAVGASTSGPIARDGACESGAPVALTEPDRWAIARREMELLEFPVTIDPLTFLARDEAGRDIDWSRYTPIARLQEYPGQRVHVCGLMVADRINVATTRELMKFVTLADRTGFVETMLFPREYQRFGHLTVAHPIVAATGIVEPFENGRGLTLRIVHLSRPCRVKCEGGKVRK